MYYLDVSLTTLSDIFRDLSALRSERISTPSLDYQSWDNFFILSVIFWKLNLLYKFKIAYCNSFI